jgi:hypothetical protein
MAIPRIKATYSLDVETVQALERTAQRLGVSKSEMLRRAIRSAAATEGAGPQDGAVAALAELQGSLKLDSRAAANWIAENRAERQARHRRQPIRKS